MTLGGWSRVWIIFSLLGGIAIFQNEWREIRPVVVRTVPLRGAGMMGMVASLKSEVVHRAADQCPDGRAHGKLLDTWEPGPQSSDPIDAAMRHSPKAEDFNAVEVTCDNPPPFNWPNGLWNAALPGLILGAVLLAVGWIRAGFRHSRMKQRPA